MSQATAGQLRDQLHANESSLEDGLKRAAKACKSIEDTMASIPDMTFKVVHAANDQIIGEKARELASTLESMDIIPPNTVRFSLSAGVDEIMQVDAEYLITDEPKEATT